MTGVDARKCILVILLVIVICILYQPQTSYQDSHIDKKSQQQESPIKQYESGNIIKNIKCPNYMQLAEKAETGYPVCLTPSTEKILASRGFIVTLGTLSTNPPILQSISYGRSPLTVGFYLTESNPFTLKNWNFGDNKTDNLTNSYIENHQYFFPHRNGKIWNFTGNVTVMDSDKTQQYIVSFKVSLLNKTRQYITNFDQYESIIYQNDADGFSVNSGNIGEQPIWSWTWGDDDSDHPVGSEYTNPFHTYTIGKNFTGDVAIIPRGFKQPIDDWPFGVLVLNYSEPRPTRIYDDVYPGKEFVVDTDMFRVNQNLCFYFSADNNHDVKKTFENNDGRCGVKGHENIKNRLTDIDKISHVTWFFGNKNVTSNDPLDQLLPKYVFTKNGTFNVNCTIYYNDRTHVSLSKTVVIFPKDRTLTLNATSGSKGDPISVSGSYYGPETRVRVLMHVGNVDYQEGAFYVDNLTKTFTGQFNLKTFGVGGPQHIQVKDYYGGDPLADVIFTIK
jgi:hypothetical protein